MTSWSPHLPAAPDEPPSGLPTMADLDVLSAELDQIDVDLARMDAQTERVVETGR